MRKEKAELLIGDGKGAKLFQPAVEEGIEWSTERRGTPGKLTFKVLADKKLGFSEGCPVRLKAGGHKVFFGFVFKQQRSKKEGKVQEITVTAYDQLRYLNNKDTRVYEGKTASQLVKMVADDYKLSVGELEDTGYAIPSRVEDNTSLFEMIENALDLTMQNRKEMYVLYDDFGKLALKNIANMAVQEKGRYLVVDGRAGEDFDYTSSIDGSTYNKIKLAYDNGEEGKREVYIAQDSSSINRWGVLQYFDTLKEGENGQAKADALLKLYNQKARTLKISKAIGDSRVRAGSTVVADLGLGDKRLMNFMLVEKCTHTYKGDEHWMDLTLKGGGFNA